MHIGQDKEIDTITSYYGFYPSSSYNSKNEISVSTNPTNTSFTPWIDKDSHFLFFEVYGIKVNYDSPIKSGSF